MRLRLWNHGYVIGSLSFSLVLYHTAWNYGLAIEGEQVNMVRALLTEIEFPVMFEWLSIIGSIAIVDIAHSIEEWIYLDTVIYA
jgi:hypothetical protein